MAVNAEADHGVREELEQLKAALREWRDAVADNSKYRGTRNRRDNERAIPACARDQERDPPRMPRRQSGLRDCCGEIEPNWSPAIALSWSAADRAILALDCADATRAPSSRSEHGGIRPSIRASGSRLSWQRNACRRRSSSGAYRCLSEIGSNDKRRRIFASKTDCRRAGARIAHHNGRKGEFSYHIHAISCGFGP